MSKHVYTHRQATSCFDKLDMRLHLQKHLILSLSKDEVGPVL